MREDIVLSCSRFRNNQIALRKRRIKKDKNTENRILNSSKNFVEKTETWKTLEESLSNNKVPESDWKGDFVCPGKTLMSYVPNCTHIFRRNRIF